MTRLSPPWSSAYLWLPLLAVGLAIWCTVFLADKNRPVSAQERADLLASAAYRGGSFSIPTPPSAEHWAQRHTVLVDGRRIVVAREASALWIALWGGSSRVAGITAFALAAVALGFAFSRLPGSAPPLLRLLAVALLLGAVSHSREWYLRDPFPFLLLGFSGLGLGAWLRVRAADGGRAAWCGLGVAVAGLMLCAPEIAVSAALVCAVDLVLARRTDRGDRRSSPFVPALPWLLAPLLLVLVFFAVRNRATTGEFLRSPASAYASAHLTAPDWLWETIGMPQQTNDPVLERYDESVLLPASRWPVPVLKNWTTQIGRGLSTSAGWTLGSLALLIALFHPAARTLRPARLLLLTAILLTIFRYRLPLDWWLLATPAIGALLLAALPAPAPPKLLACVGALYFIGGYFSEKMRPELAEYTFKGHLKEVEQKLGEETGPHLVFVRVTDSADPKIEPGDLPTDWQGAPILYARDLGTEANTSLLAAMPGRKSWRIFVFPDRVGLQKWPVVESESTSR
jgi:hypothetical protein